MIGDLLKSNCIDPRSLIAGILTVILITGFSFYVVPNVIDLENRSLDEWNFSSPITVASGLENHLSNLVYLQVLVGTITTTIQDDRIVFSFDTRSFFENRLFYVSILRIFTNLTDSGLTSFEDLVFGNNEWQMSTRDCCGGGMEYAINSSKTILRQLQQSLESDLKKIVNYENVTDNYFSVVEELELLVGEQYFEILHIYDDAKLVRIGAYGSNIVIQDLEVEGFSRVENGFSIKSDNSADVDGSFRGNTLDAPFENYVGAINNVIRSVSG